MTFTFLLSRVGFEEHPSMSVGKLSALCHDAATERRWPRKQQATISRDDEPAVRLQRDGLLREIVAVPNSYSLPGDIC
jgi:hypothetical protein